MREREREIWLRDLAGFAAAAPPALGTLSSPSPARVICLCACKITEGAGEEEDASLDEILSGIYDIYTDGRVGVCRSKQLQAPLPQISLIYSRLREAEAEK